MQATEWTGFKNHLNQAVWAEIGKKKLAGPGPGRNFFALLQAGPGRAGPVTFSVH